MSDDIHMQDGDDDLVEDGLSVARYVMLDKQIRHYENDSL